MNQESQVQDLTVTNHLRSGRLYLMCMKYRQKFVDKQVVTGVESLQKDLHSTNNKRLKTTGLE